MRSKCHCVYRSQPCANCRLFLCLIFALPGWQAGETVNIPRYTCRRAHMSCGSSVMLCWCSAEHTGAMYLCFTHAGVPPTGTGGLQYT